MSRIWKIESSMMRRVLDSNSNLEVHNVKVRNQHKVTLKDYATKYNETMYCKYQKETGDQQVCSITKVLTSLANEYIICHDLGQDKRFKFNNY